MEGIIQDPLLSEVIHKLRSMRKFMEALSQAVVVGLFGAPGEDLLISCQRRMERQPACPVLARIWFIIVIFRRPLQEDPTGLLDHQEHHHRHLQPPLMHHHASQTQRC